MKTTIPAAIGAEMEGMTVMNYISFEDFEDDESDPAKLICTTTVGDKYKHEVLQYSPDADLGAETSLYNEQLAIPASDSPFKPSPEVDNYETESDDVDAWAICTIDLVLNENTYYMAADIFDKIYWTTYGVKIFDVDGANPIDVAETEFLIELPSPTYDDTWDNEEEEKLAEKKFKIDTYALINEDRDAFMAFEVEFDVSPLYEEPDTLIIKLVADAPAESLAAGGTASLWTQFKKVDSYDGNYMKMSMEVTLGTADSGFIANFYGTGKYDDEAA